MATLFKVGEKPKTIEPKNGSDFQLEEVWDLIGGYVQVVQLHGGNIMLVDEDGFMKQLPFNREATVWLVGHCDFQNLIAVVGTALVCKSEEFK